MAAPGPTRTWKLTVNEGTTEVFGLFDLIHRPKILACVVRPSLWVDDFVCAYVSNNAVINKIVFPWQPASIGNSLFVYTCHEAAHVVVKTLSRRGCPSWLDEGIAMYVENCLTGVLADITTTRHSINASDVLHHAQLIQNPSAIALHDNAKRYRVISKTAMLIVTRYVDRHGVRKLRDDLEGMQSPAFAAEFQRRLLDSPLG